MEKSARGLTTSEQDKIMTKASDTNWENFLLDDWLKNPHNLDDVTNDKESIAQQFQRLAMAAGLIMPESVEAHKKTRRFLARKEKPKNDPGRGRWPGLGRKPA